MVFPKPTFLPSSYCLGFPPEHEPPELCLVERQLQIKGSNLTWRSWSASEDKSWFSDSKYLIRCVATRFSFCRSWTICLICWSESTDSIQSTHTSDQQPLLSKSRHRTSARSPCEHLVHRMEHRGLTFSWLFPIPVSDLQGLIAIPKVSSQGQHFGHAAVKGK